MENYKTKEEKLAYFDGFEDGWDYKDSCFIRKMRLMVAEGEIDSNTIEKIIKYLRRN